MSLRRGAALALACGALAGCASWRGAERVAPPIAGTLAGGGGVVPTAAAIERSVRHHENPRLGATDAALVAPDGSFEFPPLNLATTGQEFSKTYVLTVSLVPAAGGERRTLFREEYSRLAQRERLVLVCDLAVTDGLPCRSAP